MPPGQQAVQSSHSLADAILKFPEDAKKWHEESNYLVLLSVKDLFILVKVLRDLEKTNIKFCPFREPDIGDELTAIALMPSAEAKDFCKNFKLALSAKKKTENLYSMREVAV